MPPPVRAHYPDDATVLFLADLHLDASRPAMTEAFCAFCAGPARSADAVYILGDLFEVWIGDDDEDPCWQPVLDALAALTASGVPVHFMAGNRDFLVGADFVARTGIDYLADADLIALGERRAVLCHGDTLCTDDHDYQAFRRQVRDPQWQRDFLARPLAERRGIAAGLRADSGTAMADKSTTAMDVNPDAARTLCRQHAADCLIHGHTHRPGHDRLNVDGRVVERWVLADWFSAPSVLRAHGGRLEPVNLDGAVASG